MKTMIRIGLGILFMMPVTLLFAVSNPPKTDKPGLPDLHVSVPGTPYIRTIGQQGMAVQCVYPFDRICIIYIMKGSTISDFSPCLKAYGKEMPLVNLPEIEPGTSWFGIPGLHGSGYTFYPAGTAKVHCEEGILEIDFPYEIH